MNTIAMNTMTGSVSHYVLPEGASVQGDLVGAPTGLFQWGGDTDNGAAINCYIETGKKSWDEPRKKLIDIVFVGAKGVGQAKLTILGEQKSFDYLFQILPDGESRCVPGRGIRENYLAFGLSNTLGRSLQIDRVSVETKMSNLRRTK